MQKPVSISPLRVSSLLRQALQVYKARLVAYRRALPAYRTAKRAYNIARSAYHNAEKVRRRRVAPASVATAMSPHNMRCVVRPLSRAVRNVGTFERPAKSAFHGLPGGLPSRAYVNHVARHLPRWLLMIEWAATLLNCHSCCLSVRRCVEVQQNNTQSCAVKAFRSATRWY